MAEEIKETKETPAPASSSSSSAPSKGGSKAGLIIIIIVLVIVAVLGVAGWAISRFVGQKIGENAAEGIAGALTGAKVDIGSNGESLSVKTDEGSVNLGNKASWPSDMPNVVPKFTYGSITGSITSKDPASWSVTYNEADTDAYAKYQKDLQYAGFTTKEQAEMSGIKTMEMQHVDYQILFSIDTNSKSGNIDISEVAK